MSHRPRIGLNAGLLARPGRAGLSYLDEGYYYRLDEAGAVPIILPPIADEAKLRDLLADLDGLVLTGGEDLDPRNDGCHLTSWTRIMDPRRERFDRLLVQLARENKTPLLAIGGGMQLLNVACGGTLFYHLPKDLQGRGLPHVDPDGAWVRHGLQIFGGLVSTVWGEGGVSVVSRHHQAVDAVAPDFEVTARAPDGVFEAIESRAIDWLAVGVQWHPEDREASELDRLLFEKWLESAGFEQPRRSLHSFRWPKTA
jgi:putative glutamine amidotransferase